VKRAYPSLTLLEKGYEKTLFTDVAYFEIVTPATDKDIYNFTYFFVSGGKLAARSSNCFDDEKDDWRIIMRQAVKSLRII
jgi:hypothetical protein